MSPVPSGDAPTGLRPLRLLVIDDSPADLELIREALVSADPSVEIATAIAGDKIDLDRLDALPDLILLDVHMPRLDGIEVLQRLKAEPTWRLIPTIVRSGNDFPEDVTRAYVEQANAFIHKPRDFEGLVVQMRAMLTFWSFNRTPSWRGTLG